MTKSDLDKEAFKTGKKKRTRKVRFIPAIARWVVERSNAWVERCKDIGKEL
jgi:hypothetical protein